MTSPKSKRGVMTKSLEQIQQENRKFILEAIHGCSYEDALEKEEGDFCHYLYKTNYGEKTIIGDVKSYGYNREKHHPDAFLIKIIGKPLTLSRVLLAFKNKEVKTCYGDEAIFNIGLVDFYEIESGAYRENHHFEYICDWDLTKETLEEQSEKTQRGINKFFND